ncbi:alpha/beta hydrolase [Phenylobacterium sp.]|uniref:alpha/beta hydrolase n=1 Tax=Phenylobacterium sp. TaxID=1871053 RepID=UPI00289CC149|nr:alpha/beta hydrolase [Phenylobacterium sp.]
MGAKLAVILAMAAAGAAGAQPAERPRGCEAVAAQPQTLPGAESFTYEAAGRDLRLHVYPAAGGGAAQPAILFFFGGGWRQGDVRAFEGQAQAMAQKGMVAVLADYRVTCRDGTTAAESAQDAMAAYDWLRAHAAELKIDPERVVLAGGSAGGHLALATAMRAADRPAALVLFNPAVDLVSIAPALRLSPEAARAISPSALPAGGLPPTMIFHGQADVTVPIQTVRDFCRRASEAGRRCELHEYAGQTHGFFNSRAEDPAIGASPYADTLARAIAFLQGLELARP